MLSAFREAQHSGRHGLVQVPMPADRALVRGLALDEALLVPLAQHGLEHLEREPRATQCWRGPSSLDDHDVSVLDGAISDEHLPTHLLEAP